MEIKSNLIKLVTVTTTIKEMYETYMKNVTDAMWEGHETDGISRFISPAPHVVSSILSAKEDNLINLFRDGYTRKILSKDACEAFEGKVMKEIVIITGDDEDDRIYVQHSDIF